MSSTLPGSQSPAPSFASKESFATAQEDSPVISGLLSPPQTLRKSVSVDSFVSYKAQQHEHPTSPRKLFAITQAPTHSRDSSDTSDEDLSSRSQQRGQMSPGELLLPSRTPASPTVASDGVQRIASASSLPTYVPKRSIPVALAGRARSGSLGIYLPSSEKTSQQDKSTQAATTLIVVGMTGCGKTAIIKTGLKDYILSEPSPTVSSSSFNVYRYSRRISRNTDREYSGHLPLHVIEIDLAVSQADSQLPIDPSIPRVDGVLICYDASNRDSFRHVEGLLRTYRAMRLSTVVLASKSDLEKEVDPQRAIEIIQQYDVGLVEVTNSSQSGREKMQRSFQWILKSIRVARRSTRSELDDFRNPASPDMLVPPPWEAASGAATPTSPPAYSASSVTQVLIRPPIPPASSTPSTPSRMRSTGDLISEKSLAHTQEKGGEQPSDILSPPSNGPTLADVLNGTHEVREEKKEVSKDMRPAQWASLDELLDKLMFLAVSGDDPTFITHFLLTYRRFAAPRSLLLAMQKRMRQLDNPSGDPMFACYAQMRICNLLELWIRDYPYDFAVRGTAGALSALVKSIISKTYLLHYGTDLLPFLELLSSLVDKDEAWAIKLDDPAEESDDSYSLFEDDEPTVDDDSFSSSDSIKRRRLNVSINSQSRERRPSLPLASIPPSLASPVSDHVDTRQQLRELLRIASEVNLLDPEEIAQEITRMEAKLFLEIEPRHWLQYTLVPGKKDPETNSIVRFNNVSNHLAAWVVSLILCHDRPRSRVRQIEKFVDVAQKLRGLNNYSALRAVVAGINSSTFSGDQTMEQFKARSPEQAKNLQSWVVLLQHIRSHRAYRLALRNTKGACIPALEVHMSDLIRSHEGNADFHELDPTKVHWGKFNMMGRFISSTTQCQAQCRATNDYNFPERPHIRELINTSWVMDEETQSWRISPQEEEEPRHRAPNQPNHHQHNNPALIRRLFFW